MEPLACTIDLKADRCDAYYASQMPGLDAGALADATGLKPEQVQVHVQMAGGGFTAAPCPAASGCARPLEWPWPWPRLAARAGQGHLEPRGRHAGRLLPAHDRAPRRDRLRRHGQGAGLQHSVVSQSIVKGSPFEGMIQRAWTRRPQKASASPTACP